MPPPAQRTERVVNSLMGCSLYRIQICRVIDDSVFSIGAEEFLELLCNGSIFLDSPMMNIMRSRYIVTAPIAPACVLPLHGSLAQLKGSTERCSAHSPGHSTYPYGPPINTLQVAAVQGQLN